MKFCKIALVFSISLIFGGIENLCNCMNFRSDRLDEISDHISVQWPNCDSVFTIEHGDHNITIRIADNCVEHIGFSIFTDNLRTEVINPIIADFVERYWLSLTLPLKRQKSVRQQMAEDRFVFHNGGVESIGTIQNDSLLPFSCQTNPNIVTLTWGTDEYPVCRISFPVNHELILGRRMIENDRRMPQEINEVRIKERPYRSIGCSSAIYPDSLSTLWVEHLGSYINCYLKSDRYYICGADGVSLTPVFDSEMCKESIANLFTDYDIEKAGDIGLSIQHQVFGIKEQPIETTVRKFVAYSIQNGCEPFVGILSVDNDSSGSADVLVIMHNRHIGYNHILRVSVPLDCISSGKGTSYARLNAFVPYSNIKNLFKN